MKLILHSDDLGLHGEIDRAVFKAAEKGVLTSASLMANGPAAENAMKRAREFPWMGLGLHLNIVRGKPISSPEDIPSLTGEKGLFFNSAGSLILRSISGRISFKEVCLEYKRQLQKMLDHGITPTHFDGEKHTHFLIPEAVRAVRVLMDEFGIKKVRLINESPVCRLVLPREIHARVFFRQRLKLRLLEYRSKCARREWEGVKYPDYFFGVLTSGTTRYPESLGLAKALLNCKKQGTLEWMFHLGYPADLENQREIYGDFFLSDSRWDELQLLLSGEFVKESRRNHDKLISYREL